MQRKHNSNLTGTARLLRKNMTKEERKLWYDFLSTYNVRFLRQKVIDEFVVDFYCNKARLIIELDGSQHYEQNTLIKDKIRTEKLQNHNLTILRIPNNEIYEHFNEVCEYIDWFVKNAVTHS